MNDFLTEDQQAEQLKKWWAQHGKSVVTGVMLGLAVMFGWNWWEKSQAAARDSASLAFDLFLKGERDGIDGVDAQGQRVIDEHGGTYATLAAFRLAAIASKKGEFEAARKQLDWILANEDNALFNAAARLRLGRLALEMNQTELASKQLDGPVPASFDALFAELRGDIAFANGDQQAAAQAYDEAIAAAEQSSSLSLIQMKRDDLDV